jgi:hypothetical protein
MAREMGLFVYLLLFGREFRLSVVLPAIPPWLLPQPVIDLGLPEQVRAVEEGVVVFTNRSAEDRWGGQVQFDLMSLVHTPIQLVAVMHIKVVCQSRSNIHRRSHV